MTLTLAATVGLATGGVVAARGPAAAAPPSRSSDGAVPAPAAAALPDVPWLAQRGDGSWVFGRGEHGVLRRLPGDETGVAIRESDVASVLAGADGHSLVRFRDPATGRTIVDVAAPIWVSAGAWTSAGLVVTGYGDATMTSDGGLAVIDPATATSTTLVAPAPFSAALGQPAARGDVLVSATGRTVAANVCGVRLCDRQVVDVATGRISRMDHGVEGFLRAVTDDAVITTDGDYRWISGHRIDDGTEVWRQPDSALLDPVSLADGTIVGLVGSERAGWAVAAIDGSGQIRDLTTRRGRDAAPARIWRTVSSGSAIVIGRTAFEAALDAGGSVPISIITPGRWRSTTATAHLPATTTEAVR
ncbi:MAG TPA: hypothetical protein VFI34_11500 [Candidatus Limnocylindrales bacterium]|nr:hypothetical protein [Candidatus Limnocylindrales bacterium]